MRSGQTAMLEVRRVRSKGQTKLDSQPGQDLNTTTWKEDDVTTDDTPGKTIWVSVDYAYPFVFGASRAIANYIYRHVRVPQLSLVSRHILLLFQEFYWTPLSKIVGVLYEGRPMWRCIIGV
jgi:hypothetical protein